MYYYLTNHLQLRLYFFLCLYSFCLPVPSVCDGCDESATCIPDLQNLGQFICWSEEMCECEEDYDTWCSYNICMNWYLKITLNTLPMIIYT